MSGGAQQHTLHRALIRQITSYLPMVRAWHVKVLGGVGQKPGMPDVLACVNGQFVAIEAKTGKAVLTEKQSEQRAAIEMAGGFYILAHTLEDVIEALVAEDLIDRPRSLL